MKIASMKSMKALARRGGKQFRKAEKSGKLETMRKRLALATQLIEIAVLATAVAKGLRAGKADKAARRPARRAKRAAPAKARA